MQTSRMQPSPCSGMRLRRITAREPLVSPRCSRAHPDAANVRLGRSWHPCTRALERLKRTHAPFALLASTPAPGSLAYPPGHTQALCAWTSRPGTGYERFFFRPLPLARGRLSGHGCTRRCMGSRLPPARPGPQRHGPRPCRPSCGMSAVIAQMPRSQPLGVLMLHG